MTSVSEPALVDTNVLVYALFPAMPDHAASRALMDRAKAADANLCIAPQNLIEFFAVVTDPRRVTQAKTPRQIEALKPAEPGQAFDHGIRDRSVRKGQGPQPPQTPKSRDARVRHCCTGEAYVFQFREDPQPVQVLVGDGSPLEADTVELILVWVGTERGADLLGPLVHPQSLPMPHEPHRLPDQEAESKNREGDAFEGPETPEHPARPPAVSAGPVCFGN